MLQTQQCIVKIITLPFVIIFLAITALFPHNFFMLILADIIYIYYISICCRRNNTLDTYYLIQSLFWWDLALFIFIFIYLFFHLFLLVGG